MIERQTINSLTKEGNKMLNKVGQKVSRIGDVIQQPRLLKLRLRGVEVRMFERLNKPWLVNSGIKTIIDVGANTGQFSRAIHEVLPEAYIYSFEPLPDCFAELLRAMSGVRTFRAFNTALAERDGEAEFYRSSWSPSSSLLPMQQLHKQNFPFTAGESRETVRVSRLDDCARELTINNEILIKLDVQGAEDKVIEGGKSLLQHAKVLIVETSIDSLYEGQPLFADIFKLLEGLGFRYKGALTQAFSRLDGSVLYADSIFMRGT
jgi:FkbM family methyltransferase